MLSSWCERRSFADLSELEGRGAVDFARVHPLSGRVCRLRPTPDDSLRVILKGGPSSFPLQQQMINDLFGVVAAQKTIRSEQLVFMNVETQLYFGLKSSRINLSRSLKQPRLEIACNTSGSMASMQGSTWVCTTCIIGSSSSSSPFPPAVTQGCLLISDNYERVKIVENKKEFQYLHNKNNVVS